MNNEYVREISETQSKYKVVKKNITQQSSYNLPIELESELLNKGIIKIRYNPNSEDKNIYYELGDNVKLKLGEGIINIIGKKYETIDVKVILVHTSSNGKFQIRRNEHNVDLDEYNWFKELYDNNIEGANFIVEYNEDLKILSFDNKLVYSSVAKEENSNEVNEVVDLSEEELARILKEEYENAAMDKEQMAKVHLFGIKYGNLMKEKNLNPKNIIQLAGLDESLYYELNKGIKLAKFVVLANNHKESIIEIDNERLHSGTNVIYYGTPGCGKSHYVKDHFCKDEKYYERITFHQEYSNGDFVGQIRPKVVEKEDQREIEYVFIPGPLTNIIKKAYNDKYNMYYLIIEELNRGNAPAIFGDTFQLLDRDCITKQSEYPIDNDDMSIEIYGEKNHKIFLPSNLSIIATMNTNDQNVFVLDTAFKRRWEWVKISNKFKDRIEEDSTNYTREIAEMYVPVLNISWKDFVEKLNIEILDKKYGENGEDKQLGVYFVDKSLLSVEIVDVSNYEKRKRFAEKVLMYLWEDVAKYYKEGMFNNYDTLDDLLDDFVNNKNVFKNEIFEDRSVEDKDD